MKKSFATLALVAALGLPLAAHADENADKIAVAKTLVEKTLIKTLDTGFRGALEKTVGQMPDEKADKVRKEANAEFDTQRNALLEGLSKNYAEKFSLDELKHLQGIYDDPVYLKFQAVNSDPQSEINLIAQASVTRLLNMLTLVAQSDQQGGIPGAPGPDAAPMPAPGGSPGPAPKAPMQMPAPAK